MVFVDYQLTAYGQTVGISAWGAVGNIPRRNHYSSKLK